MKTFEQWLMEQQVTPAAPVGAPAAPAAPTPTPAPAQNQQAQQAQQTNQTNQQAPEKAPIEPGQEGSFVTKAKMEMQGGAGGGNEAYDQIRKTLEFYHNDQSRQTTFTAQMTQGFKELGEEHPFNKYLKIMIDKAKLGQYDPGDKPIDLTQPFDNGYGSGFTPIGYEGEQAVDTWGQAISQAVGELDGTTGISGQSQRSVFGQN